MKKPKFRGHRKGYSELWLGEANDAALARGEDYETIRLRTSHGEWMWDAAESDREFEPFDPCWLGAYYLSPVKSMKRYDKEKGHKTIFLGYIKGI